MKTRVLLLAGLFAACATMLFARTTDEVLREANGLFQMGKPEHAFASIAAQVKAVPSSAQALRPTAQVALNEALSRARQMQQNSPYDCIVILRQMWPAMIDKSASAPLFPTEAEYERTMEEVYNRLFDSSYRAANNNLQQGNFDRALQYAQYCVDYRPSDPDPRAVALLKQVEERREEANKANAAAAIPVGFRGVVFPLKTANDDGFTDSLASQNKPNARVGGAKICFGASFPDVAIPKGARIKSAQVRAYFVDFVTWDTGVKATPPFQTTIAAEDVDDGTPVGSLTEPVHNRPTMARQVPWQMNNPVQGWVSSPDLTPIIQAVVNREGWQPGNRLNLLFSFGLGQSEFISFEQDPSRAFRLLVDWE